MVACLPPARAICGHRNIMVDPFLGTRLAFPSNRSGDSSSIAKYVRKMWSLSKVQNSTSHTGLYHGNLLEILEMCAVVPPGTSRSFYLEDLGMNATPSDEVENLLLEAEADALLGTGRVSEMTTGILHRPHSGQSVLWEESANGTFLTMQGYGCICRWPVLFFENSAIVIQPKSSEHTSVTNMAEHVRDACRKKLGAYAKCYEFYEPRVDEKISPPCEITGQEGESAGWIPVEMESLPCLQEWLRARQKTRH